MNGNNANKGTFHFDFIIHCNTRATRCQITMELLGKAKAAFSDGVYLDHHRVID